MCLLDQLHSVYAIKQYLEQGLSLEDQREDGEKTRGNKRKLKHERVQACVRTIFFPISSVKHWNKLLRKGGQTVSLAFLKFICIMS